MSFMKRAKKPFYNSHKIHKALKDLIHKNKDKHGEISAEIERHTTREREYHYDSTTTTTKIDLTSLSAAARVYLFLGFRYRERGLCGQTSSIEVISADHVKQYCDSLKPAMPA